MYAIRFPVTLLVAVSLVVWAGWPPAWYVSFLIACLSLGSGRIAEALFERPPASSENKDLPR